MSLSLQRRRSPSRSYAITSSSQVPIPVTPRATVVSVGQSYDSVRLEKTAAPDSPAVLTAYSPVATSTRLLRSTSRPNSAPKVNHRPVPLKDTKLALRAAPVGILGCKASKETGETGSCPQTGSCSQWRPTALNQARGNLPAS
jgi:hypothetical protein